MSKNYIFIQCFSVLIFRKYSAVEPRIKEDFDMCTQGLREFKKPVGAQAKKSQKLTPILQNLRFIAFLHYNFQKPVGARAR